jgi:hypothetical protein
LETAFQVVLVLVLSGAGVSSTQAGGRGGAVWAVAMGANGAGGQQPLECIDMASPDKHASAARVREVMNPSSLASSGLNLKIFLSITTFLKQHHGGIFIFFLPLLMLGIFGIVVISTL